MRISHWSGILVNGMKNVNMYICVAFGFDVVLASKGSTYQNLYNFAQTSAVSKLETLHLLLQCNKSSVSLMCSCLGENLHSESLQFMHLFYFPGFECYRCKIGKPIDEFPPNTVTEKCKHAPLECLRVTLLLICKILNLRLGRKIVRN